MSFLTPLYALGALAVALPILFHLIQRRPRGEQWFSSLMFLTSSTPRITRRSRLSNMLLLLLRAAALMLLAAAFARPFLRTLAAIHRGGPRTPRGDTARSKRQHAPRVAVGTRSGRSPEGTRGVRTQRSCCAL